MKKIYIYGAGGHGLVVGDIALALDYDVVFIDDGDSEYQSFEDVKNDTNTPMIIGIGDNKI